MSRRATEFPLAGWLSAPPPPSACQPLPHPFETEDKGFNPLLQLKDGVGITVLPATGVPPALGRQLAEALAAAFRDAEVPAAVEDGNRGSFVVTGVGRLGPELEIEWDPAAPSGALLGNVVQREQLAAGPRHPPPPPDPPPPTPPPRPPTPLPLLP